MTIQKMNWGYIDWLCTNDGGTPGQSMNIGICTILPRQRQHEHIHYGVEQFIFILKGESLHIVNGQEFRLTKGNHLHMQSGVTHDTVNTTDQPVVELMVSIPVSFSYDLSRTQSDDELGGRYHGNLYAAVEAIDSHLLDSFHAPFTIFDDGRSKVFQHDFFSPFCHEKCGPTSEPADCECLSSHREPHMVVAKDHRWFVCSHGHLVYHLPIMYRGRELGAIRGGHIVVSEISGHFGPKGVYDTPKSTAIGIQKLLRQVIKSIQAYCEFDATRLELKKRNRTLWETETHRISLEKNLRMAESKVTSLRINRHFLFNTLNCMADMALKKKGESLYEAIIQLSRMFRYVIPTEKTSVPLGEELEYVNNYLSLQKLRYGNNLLVARSVDSQLLSIPVPINFLQPIVENAFIHGFRDSVGLMNISLEVAAKNESVVVSVRNNGKRLDDSVLLRVKNGLTSNSGHGLSLIFTKLSYAYGDDFDMDITSEWDAYHDSLTCVKLILPKAFKGRYDD
ncbi:histidine kinase [Deltaproteobacteria bacterium Smac51]|nr:histidine kinase [Deltaproteobacteria bacterium Smac51]